MKGETKESFLKELMSKANMGWWKADMKNEIYFCSEYICKLLGLNEDGIISFSDFNKRILKDEQRPMVISSFVTIQQMEEATYLFDTVKGPIWLRSKICYREEDEEGNLIIYGIAEVQDGPNTASAYQALLRNERILHNIYKNLPVGIELYDTKGILISINDKELDMFHLEQKEDILGIDIFKNPIFPEEMKKKLKRNEDADFTFRYDFSKIGCYYKTKKNEGTIDLVTKVTTLYDENHVPINYLLINADKTEMTVAYNKIQEFEGFFELIGNYAKVGYAHYNMLTQEGHAQKSWYKNLGEPINRPLNEIVGVYGNVYPEEREEVVHFIQEALAGKASNFSKEVRIRRENGEYTWTSINLLVKNYDPANDLIELISINYDITKLKQTEMMLIKARDKAEESDRLKSAFLANMRHEIRTPLNAIVGFSSLLASTENADDKEMFVKQIQYNNELLLNILNAVLDISWIESGNVEFHPEWLDLTGLVCDTVDEFRRDLSQGVVLNVTYPEKECFVELDSMRVRQILDNLLSNAVKYTEQGAIHISYELHHGFVVLSVSDTGCGIPKDKMDKIFERFEKVDYYVQGVGLGLPISKSLIEKMGGKIEVSSCVGEGSTFTVTLPCRVMLLDKLVENEEIS